MDFLNAHTIQYALVVNPNIYVSCIKQFWATATIKKVNDAVKLRALIDKKKVVVTEDVIKRDLCLDDCVSAKRTAWNKISCFMASAIICLATGRKFNFSKYIFDSMDPTPTPLATPPQVQPFTPPASPPQEQPTTTSESSMSLLTTLMETCATLSKKVTDLEQDKHTQALEILKLKKRVKKLEKKKQSRSFGFKRLRKTQEEVAAMDAKLQGRIDQDDEPNAANKGVNAAEPTVFDVKEEIKKAAASEKQEKDDLERAKVLQKQYEDKEENIDWNAVTEGMTYDKVRPIFEREYKKVQTLFKPDKDVEEPKKKRVAEETLLQESFKKLKLVEVLGSEFTQETPSNDPKEMSKEDVQNMLEIVLMSKFKVEALQVKYPIIDWEIHSEGLRTYWKIIRVSGITEAYQSFKDMLKGFNREDLMQMMCYGSFKEKDYPLSNGVMTLTLSAKLQVQEDSEMARDLVMKIFMKANKPKSRSLDTSSKILYCMKCKDEDHRTSAHEMHVALLKRNENYKAQPYQVFSTRRQQIEETYHVTFDERKEAIKFTNTLINEIVIDDSSRYPHDEFLYEDDPSRQYQANSYFLFYIIPHGHSRTKLIKDTHVLEVIAPNEQDIPHTKDVEVPEVPQSQSTYHASTSSYPFAQDRWSRDQHIELLNIIGLVVPSFLPSDDLIASLNKAMAFISTAFSSHYPLTNNQLKTSSNPRNQATIQDGEVIVENVQGRQTQSYTGNIAKGNATGTEANKNMGITIANQSKFIRSYNCKGEGHMARQCTQPNKTKNLGWFKEKKLLAQAKQAEVILDEEQLPFLADTGERANSGTHTQALPTTAIF
nr:hypothetical protein [Tanacetum cinerariifolium]